MTQLRFHPGSISNYFDAVLSGIGKRGSSFSDIDAVSHDRDSHRFLVQEFKRQDEAINQGQHWMLKDLAAIPSHFTVWHVEKRAGGLIGFAEYGQPLRAITVADYQRRFHDWWNNEPADVPVDSGEPLTADDISWHRTRHSPRLQLAREPGQEG